MQHHQRSSMTRRNTLVAAAIVVAAGLGGCAAEDVQLQGKIFDVVGLNAQEKPREPKVAARAPLVVPPSLDRIPEPGAPAALEGTAMASLNDPDKVKTQNRAELEKAQAEYCRKHYELPKAVGDTTSADLAEGPLGSCRGSVLNLVKQLNGGEEK